MTQPTRRTLLQAGAAIALTGSAMGRAQAQAAARLRLYWWGNPDRDKRTKAVVEAYLKRDGAPQLATESLPWGEYWTKLGTQTAGGNAPDLIQMDYRYIAEYARRDALLPLEGVKGIDLSGFTAGGTECGKVDGKLYGVDFGNNSKAMLYDIAMFEKVGAKPSMEAMAWDEFVRVAGEISKINPGKYWGTGDASRWEQSYEQWLNMRGKLLYTPDGKLGYTKEDAAEWYEAWDKLRKSGACAPAEVASINTGAIDQYELPKGLAAMSYLNSNQITAMQSLTKAKLGLAMHPRVKGGSSGHYLKPSMLMSISSKSKAPEDAAKFINFLINDPEAVKILGIERGVPESAKARALLLPELDELAQSQISYLDILSKIAVPLPPPAPKGAGEIDVLMRKIGDTVAFGKATPAEGGKQLATEAASILERA